MIEIVFETHSISDDNEAGVASGWNPSRLSERGRALATELGARRQHDDIDTVFCSDLRRAVETAEIAFAGTKIPILRDWRLRECDYGELNGAPHQDRGAYLDTPYPGGESWRQAIARVARFLDDLRPRWEGTRILVIGHVATRWGFEHTLNGVPLETLAARDFQWQEGWAFRLGTP